MNGTSSVIFDAAKGSVVAHASRHLELSTVDKNRNEHRSVQYSRPRPQVLKRCLSRKTCSQSMMDIGSIRSASGSGERRLYRRTRGSELG